MPAGSPRRGRSSELESQMSAEARALFRQVKRRIERKRQEMKKTPLMVLIWGPGKSGGALYEKRKQIRARLIKEKFAAAFSEDLCKIPQEGDSLRVEEMIQASEADLVVLLYGSPGSIGEFHDFAQTKAIVSKMEIFVDSRQKDGYAFAGTLREANVQFGNVHTYVYPDDVTQCHLLGKVLTRLETMRRTKWAMANFK